MRLLLCLACLARLAFGATATDAFTRANENPITSPWLVHPGSGANLQLVSNTVGGVSSTDSAAVYNTAYTATGDHYSEMEFSNVSTDSDAGPAVKWTNTGSMDGYFCVCHSAGEAIGELNVGSYNQLAVWTVTNFAVTDVARAKYEGGAIKCTRNGAEEGALTDSGHTGNYVGWFQFNGAVRLDNWAGGDLGGAPAARRMWSVIGFAMPSIVKWIDSFFPTVHAQSGQDRYYLMNMIGSGDYGARDGTRPAHADTHLQGYSWASMNYGAEMITLVLVKGISSVDHNALAAEPNVDAFPVDIDSTVTTGKLANVQAIMESRRIPGNWVTVGTTYREIARKTAAAFQFFKRMRGKGFGNILAGGRTMDTTFGELPAGARQNVIDTADELGYDRTELNNSSTLRQVLKRMADEWGAKPINMLGVPL